MLLIITQIEDRFVFFNWRRGISFIPTTWKKVFTVTAPVCQLKVRFTFLQKSDYIGKASVFNSWIAHMRKSEL